MIDFNNIKAAKTTETRDLNTLAEGAGNIYQAIAIISKYADQLNDELREELHGKLEEFASHSDTLEEIFENKEQIEISRFYEKMPKPMALAIEEWQQGKIYHRDPQAETTA
jgi:DNA-directed RNA polymerase subunit K/omega